MYDALAPFYRQYSAKRESYLHAVEQTVIDRIPAGATSLLDVGAGDGVRAMRIAGSRGISRIVLAEPSEAMARLARQHADVEVWNVAAENLSEATERFDVITCLWNVVGHIPHAQARSVGLRKMAGLLSRKGVLFVDVNNRYNAASYGWIPTLKRMFWDIIRPAETNGDIRFEWEVEGKRIPATGHFFTPAEMRMLLRSAGLEVRRRYVIDYDSGLPGRFVWQGQLLFEAGHP